MVNPAVTDVERELALTYAPVETRGALMALLALDDRLAAILRTTREPLIGQMRLTWWHEALTALDAADAPAEPVLQALADSVIARVSGALLATMIEGWEVLLDQELDRAALTAHAERRGATLFAAMGTVTGTTDATLRAAGQGWALVDLARHVRDPALAEQARQLALAAFDAADTWRWPPAARAIGALARSARMDLAASPRPHGHPARTARLLWLRITGR